ncbi:MAG: response regulator transcription factor [Cytophagales bacterium]|nr:response regulator transcription factor [Cytophagales bacterium]
MKLNCIIIEDEPLARNLLIDYVSKVPTLQLIQAFGNPLEALEVLRTQPVDLLFLDVQMPQLTGISLLKVLQHKPMVILTTAYSEYALVGYELDVADYLLKPVTFERFLKAIDKVSLRLTAGEAQPTEGKSEPAPKDFVFVKDGTKSVRVQLSEILYIEGLKDYVTIHTPGQKIVTLQRMKTLEEQLPADGFIRIHNSFIVSVKAIDVVHKNEVQIGQATLPIGDTYRKGFREFIEKHHIQ